MAASSSPDALLRQIAGALRSDPERAAKLAEAALATGLLHPILHHASGVWMAKQGRHEEAIQAFRRADALPPPNIATKSAMAVSLVAVGRHPEAVKVLDGAIALRPDLAGLHVQKAWALEANGELVQAGKALEKALALQPDDSGARARLSFLAARRGDWAEATGNAERALGSGTAFPAAHLSLAMCALEQKRPEVAKQHLRTVLEDPAAGPTDRQLAQALLGDTYDLRGQSLQAFSAWQDAKRMVRERPGRQSWSPSMFDVVTGLIRYFDAKPAIDLQSAPRDVPPHIFVFGFLRSGTTLIQHVLSSRDDVVLLQEKETLADAVRAFMAVPQDLDRLWAASEEMLGHHRDLYWQNVASFGVEPAGRAMVDGMPINTIKMPLIARLFPGATMVMVIRDPRDVILSCLRRTFVENATTDELLTLEGAARFYDAVMTLAELCRSRLNLSIHTIRLEDVIADFDGETRKLCEAAGLDWSDSMRSFAKRANDSGIATPSGPQIARGLNADGVGVWRRYREYLAPVLDILAPWVERFGYDAA